MDASALNQPNPLWSSASFHFCCKYTPLIKVGGMCPLRVLLTYIIIKHFVCLKSRLCIRIPSYFTGERWWNPSNPANPMDPQLNIGPKPFDRSNCNGNVAQSFEHWVDTFEIFIDHIMIDPVSSEPESVLKYQTAKNRALLWHIGKEGCSDIHLLCPEDRTDATQSYTSIVHNLRNRFCPKSANWQAIVQFRALRQEAGESTPKFAEHCEQHAKLCGFETPEFNEGDPINKNLTLEKATTNGMLLQDATTASHFVANGHAPAK